MNATEVPRDCGAFFGWIWLLRLAIWCRPKNIPGLNVGH